MLQFFRYVIQFTVFLLAEELLIGIFGIDKIIERAIPGISPYLHPLGTIILLGAGYVYLRFWFANRQRTSIAPAAPTDKLSSFMRLWNNLNDKSARLEDWVHDMVASDGMLNRLVGVMVGLVLAIIAMVSLFLPFILIALLVLYLTGL